MTTRTEATIDDLYRLAGDGKAELVDGEVVLVSPSGVLPNYAAFEIAVSLRDHVKKIGTGHWTGDNLGFVVDLPNRKSFSPDAAYHLRPLTMKFITGAPVFAVEVRSESDYSPAADREIAEKRADYFAAGTLVVRDVDLQGADTVRSYRAEEPDRPLVFRRGETAHAEPAVPGWPMPVDDLSP